MRVEPRLMITFFLFTVSELHLLCCVSDDSLTAAAGDFVILQSSKDVHFLPDASPIAVDEIAPIIAASFGLPFQKVVNFIPFVNFKNYAYLSLTQVVSVII